MDPTIYALIKVATFLMPPNPGNVPVHPQFATVQMIKTANRIWENARNYYLSYIYISRTCFCMLDKLVPDHFMVSNNPNLIRLNLMMSIQLILARLETLYGKPMPTILWNNNTLFTLDFSPNKAPEMPFHRIEQCQEVAIIAEKHTRWRNWCQT
jgi:hypothetical protein